MIARILSASLFYFGLLPVSMMPSVAIGQTPATLNDSNFVLGDDCPATISGKSQDTITYFRCASSTAMYSKIVSVISRADVLTTQTERINLLAHANRELSIALGMVSGELESGVAKEFAEKFDVEVNKLEKYFKLSASSSEPSVSSLVRPRKWEPDYVDDNDKDGIFTQAVVDTNKLCLEEPIAIEKCKVTIEEVNKLAVLAGVARRINTTFVNLEFDKSKAKSENFVSSFDKLQTVAPFQYPWELYVNRRYLNCNLFNSDRDRYENIAGILTSLPGCHFIVLHPDAGFGFTSDAPEGSQFTEAVVLELGGFVINRYNSKDDLYTLGASLSATLADIGGDGNDLGFGVTLRYKKLALTVSAHDDQTFVFLNLELFDSFGKSNKAYEEFRKKY